MTDWSTGVVSVAQERVNNITLIKTHKINSAEQNIISTEFRIGIYHYLCQRIGSLSWIQQWRHMLLIIPIKIFVFLLPSSWTLLHYKFALRHWTHPMQFCWTQTPGERGVTEYCLSDQRWKTWWGKRGLDPSRRFNRITEKNPRCCLVAAGNATDSRHCLLSVLLLNNKGESSFILNEDFFLHFIYSWSSVLRVSCLINSEPYSWLFLRKLTLYFCHSRT